LIKEILIINDGGIGLFYQNFEEQAKVDCQVMAGFLSAIQNFAQNCAEDQLQAIVSDKDQYTFHNAKNYSVVIKASRKVSVKTLEEKIAQLKQDFEAIYREYLERQEVNSEKYNGFEEVIMNVFEIKEKPKFKSSEIFNSLLGLENKKINFKKVLNSL
jgi:hypothetical protein